MEESLIHKGEMMDKEQIYNILYGVAKNITSYHNPCKWEDGQCERDRLRNSRGGCCVNCPQLSKEGCEIKPLSCELWLCTLVASKDVGLVGAIEALKSVAYALGLDVSLARKTKEETCKKTE